MARQAEGPSGLSLLKTALKAKRLERLYFFHGEETFLQAYYLGRVKALLLDELTESFNLHRLTNETFSLRSFSEAVENLPMLSEHSLVVVEDIDLYKLPEGDRNALAELLADLPDYCTVIFTYLTVPFKPDKRMKKLWQLMEPSGTIVEFAKQEPKDLIPWISRHFRQHGKGISTGLCAYLLELTDGTMTSLAGEIDKISAFSGADEICKEDIDAVTEPVMDAVVFQMTDLLGQGRYGEALAKLHQLLKLQQEPLAILGAVGSHFRRLSAARVLLDHGKQAQQLQELCGLPGFAARKTMEAARRCSPQFLSRACTLVVETDYKIKTSADSGDRLLELLLLTLAEEARNG